MGYIISEGVDPDISKNEVLIVKVSYKEDWDLVKFMKELHIQFENGRSGEIIAVGNFKSPAAYSKKIAVKKLFDHIRYYNEIAISNSQQ